MKRPILDVVYASTEFILIRACIAAYPLLRGKGLLILILFMMFLGIWIVFIYASLHAYFATNPYGSFERALRTIAVRNGIKSGMLWGAIGSLIMALLLISIIIESVSGVYLWAGCYLLFIILMGVWYLPYTIFRVITRKEAIEISEHIKIAMYVGMPMTVFNIITETLSSYIFGDVVSHGFWRHLQIHEYGLCINEFIGDFRINCCDIHSGVSRKKYLGHQVFYKF